MIEVWGVPVTLSAWLALVVAGLVFGMIIATIFIHLED